MTLIAGASQYLSQSTFTNTTGAAAVAADILSTSVSNSLLDAGRRLAVDGIGLSSSARALNKQILEQNTGLYNGLFSASGGASATIESAQTQIAALRSANSPSRDVTIQDDGTVRSSRLGLEVDEEA